MARIEQIRGKMAQVGSTMKQLERLSVTVPILNSQGARFALQFNIGNLKQIRGAAPSIKQFLKVGAQISKIYVQVGLSFRQQSLPRTVAPL